MDSQLREGAELLPARCCFCCCSAAVPHLVRTRVQEETRVLAVDLLDVLGQRPLGVEGAGAAARCALKFGIPLVKKQVLAQVVGSRELGTAT